MDNDYIIDNITRKINIAYQVNQKCCISFIVSDDMELRKQIQEQISSIDTSTILDERIVNYDFFRNRNNGLTEYSRLCKEKGNLMITTGLEKYAEYLKQTGQITNVGDFYMNVFNLPRDSFYLQNNVRIILLLNQQEYDIFLSDYGDDFLSYAHIQEDLDIKLKKYNSLQNAQGKEESER